VAELYQYGRQPARPSPAPALGQVAPNDGAQQRAYQVSKRVDARSTPPLRRRKHVADDSAADAGWGGRCEAQQKTEADQLAQRGRDGSRDGEDNEEQVRDGEDGDAAVDLRQSRYQQQAGCHAEREDGNDEDGEQPVARLEFGQNLGHSGRDHGRSHLSHGGEEADVEHDGHLLGKRPL